MKRMLFKEDQYIQMGGEFYRVEETEEFSFRKEGLVGTVVTNTLSTFEEVVDIEPHEVQPPYMRMYQTRVGIDVGMLYLQLLRGKSRRGTRRKPAPSSSEPFIGQIETIESFELGPSEEFFLLNRHIPAFGVFNPYGFSITPTIYFRGEKMVLVNLGILLKTAPDSIPRLKEIYQDLKDGKIPHSRITKLGLGEE